jgi:hypothetical protein
MFRRTKPKTRPAEVIAAEKAKKTALAKTCQCCGRQIFAETGLIAHHGYQRPGWGYQTPSCMGAKHLPFEVDREQLGKMIRMMVRHRADFATHRAQVEAEKLPLPYAYNVRKAGKYEKMHLGLTRDQGHLPRPVRPAAQGDGRGHPGAGGPVPRLEPDPQVRERRMGRHLGGLFYCSGCLTT